MSEDTLRLNAKPGGNSIHCNAIPKNEIKIIGYLATRFFYLFIPQIHTKCPRCQHCWVSETETHSEYSAESSGPHRVGSVGKAR